MKYPGRIVKEGESDAAVVRAVQRKLNAALSLSEDDILHLDPTDPRFGPRMKQAVKLFQSRNVDRRGNPLVVDGIVGALTWNSLFGNDSVPQSVAAPTHFLNVVLKAAVGEETKGIREIPRNSNSGPQVNQYLKSVGLGPGHLWCCAFVYWCFSEAAQSLNCANPMPRTGGCLDHWRRSANAGVPQVAKTAAVDDPGLLRPGMVFVMDYGNGAGHTGFVEAVNGGFITTIEGNTDGSGTREGGGVYRLNRKVNSINKGFIDYSVA